MIRLNYWRGISDVIFYVMVELPEMKNDPTLIVKDEEIAVLESHERKLKDINDQIDAKGIELEKIVREMMTHQENPLFKEAALNFEKRALSQKIDLFNELLSQSKPDQS